MSILNRLFRRRLAAEPAPRVEQAVMVHLDGVKLPDAVYEEYDLATIEDQISEIIEREGLGEFDGNMIGGGETELYMYGPDADRLFAAIADTLRAYPLCHGAHVEIDYAGPVSSIRAFDL